MSSYEYTRDIPDADDNPSDDQPDMKINTNSIDSLIGEDHYSFGQQTPGNDAANGFHKQVRLPNLPGIPGSLINGSTTIYSKFSNDSGQVFVTNGVSGNEYQMTRTDNGNFPTFGTNTNYPTIVANQFGGWTFLPGGLLFQYGNMIATGSSTPIVFPITFSTLPFSITYSSKFSLATTSRISNESPTGFTVLTGSSQTGVGFWWMAIGN